MRINRRLRWLGCFIFASSIALAVCAAENQPPAEDEAYRQFQSVSRPLNYSPDAPPSEAEQIKWADTVIKRAESFLQTYPQSKRLNRVKLVQAYALSRRHALKEDTEDKTRCRALLQQVLGSASSKFEMVEAHKGFLEIADSPAEALQCVNAITREAPQLPDMAEIHLQLARVYAREGEPANAKATAQEIIAKFPDSAAADDSRMLLQRLEIIGTPAKLRLSTADGKIISSDDFIGKIVLVNFWGTQWRQSSAEMAVLAKIRAAYPDDDVQIVGVSLDTDKEIFRRFVADHGGRWTQCFDGKGAHEAVRRFDLQAIPATIVVDREGKIASSELRGDALIRVVADLLKKQK